jgi:hypothetical protein
MGILREAVFSLTRLFGYSRVAMLQTPVLCGSLEAEKASRVLNPSPR